MKLDFPSHTLKQLSILTGLSYGHLWRMAKKSGQKPIPGYPSQRTDKYEGVDWSRSSTDLARELGVSRQAVSEMRQRKQKRKLTNEKTNLSTNLR